MKWSLLPLFWLFSSPTSSRLRPQPVGPESPPGNGVRQIVNMVVRQNTEEVVKMAMDVVKNSRVSLRSWSVGQIAQTRLQGGFHSMFDFCLNASFR